MNDVCRNVIHRIENLIAESEKLFSNSDRIIHDEEVAALLKETQNILAINGSLNLRQYGKAPLYNDFTVAEEKLRSYSNEFSERARMHNVSVQKNRTEYVKRLVGKVEGKTLDPQQIACIAKEAHNHLVIAGAGTGKTTTIVGRVKYLLGSNKAEPNEILVLSFTNASASEMNERIKAETGVEIAASTFHKFGLDILRHSDGVVPKITNLQMKKFIREQIAENMKSSEYLKLLCSYFIGGRIVQKSEFEFETQKEYEEYLTTNPPTTIRNETVKSYGEMEIANFLYENGIEYIYENPYEFDTRTEEYAQYNPDFYLPKYGIYIEYFGITRNGDVPKYFKGKDGKSARVIYNAGIEWKRKIHIENNTVMIETFFYEKAEGKLLENLAEKLTQAGVQLNLKSPEELWKEISESSQSEIAGTVDLFETVINLLKSNQYTISDVREMIPDGMMYRSCNTILSLVEPVYDAYCRYLATNGEIDFNDMINTAASYIKQDKYDCPYKYVIVDEYQDISKARYRLLRELRSERDYNLFCVGDDWQSIYRFAGSDVGYILNFEKYWGKSEISKIETTYRFSQKLIDVSGSFVMKNPDQIKKNIHGRNTDVGFPVGEIEGYKDTFAISFALERLNDLPKDSTVFFIGRYTFDRRLLEDNSQLTCNYNNTSGFIDIVYKPRPDLKMTFLTAHRSKGLQADYVFIINNKNDKMGFPSKIQDSPLINLLLENSDQYPYAEERRLFYVAMTRAKKKVFLVTVDGRKSEFVRDLIEQYGKEIQQERFTCPLCGGQLKLRRGPYGEFFGCSNYRSKGCTYKRKITKSPK
ncbi:MAG: UvrD-helicase domain-containing protein [Oscillospiraceae bacterium]|nr:UvrD-helicase domain-containing protein [Oscillospiraceae bacterium]